MRELYQKSACNTEIFQWCFNCSTYFRNVSRRGFLGTLKQVYTFTSLHSWSWTGVATFSYILSNWKLLFICRSTDHTLCGSRLPQDLQDYFAVFLFKALSVIVKNSQILSTGFVQSFQHFGFYLRGPHLLISPIQNVSLTIINNH